MTRLVLGSSSAGRLAVLRAAGIEPLVLVSGVDEEAVIAASASGGAHPPAERVVNELAAAKADAVTALLPGAVAADCVVIGCDSMLEIDGRLCGKPGTAPAALAQWRSMAGRAGRLLTGHCALRLHAGVVVARHVETRSTTVHFAIPTADELAAYVDSGEPIGVAGGFTIDGRGGWFVDRIEGDPSNVVGLSLPLLRELLARLGVSVAELWAGAAAQPDRDPTATDL